MTISLKDHITTLESELAAAQHSLERFRILFSTACHDLRAPLANIMGFAETLQHAPVVFDRAKAERFLGIIYSQAVLMERLIEDLQLFMTLSMGQVCPDKALVFLPDLVSGVLERFEALCRKNEITVTFSSQREIPCESDSQLLGQALHRLVTYALHIEPQGGTITIISTTEQRCTVLTIRTTGTLTEEELPFLFEPFSYSGSSRKHREVTGLELIIAREILRLNGGEVTVDMAPDRSISFTISLPHPSV